MIILNAHTVMVQTRTSSEDRQEVAFPETEKAGVAGLVEDRQVERLSSVSNRAADAIWAATVALLPIFHLALGHLRA